MGKGIATIFKKKFGGVSELKQTAEIGKTSWLKFSIQESSNSLEITELFIAYIVTKEKYYNKPTWSNFKKAVTNMFVYCDEHDIKQIYLPRIGCGLDRLKWSDVKQLLLDCERKYEVNITIYVLN